MVDRLFVDRRDAGRVLADLLGHHRGRSDTVVLGLPRGGVPVAYEIATALDAPLDVFLVHKLGVPGHEELAMGAIADGGVMVLNDDVVWSRGLSQETIDEVAARERHALLRRERLYRGVRSMPELTGKVVIVADDGLATGASMRAAVQALDRLRPARIVVAVPVAPESTCCELEALADEVVCASTPRVFFAVGQSYVDFTQTDDEEVRDLLRAASKASKASGGSGASGASRESRARTPGPDG
ncbi:phosphoribosyltransferase [Streptosporangium sp. CA-135522]|uniref:phosphoribosyltransferase n=1 Tax=Streptosporangium sp. CA-135522 TaxID=3240072 RepID=UPI003D8C0449